MRKSFDKVFFKKNTKLKISALIIFLLVFILIIIVFFELNGYKKNNFENRYDIGTIEFKLIQDDKYKAILSLGKHSNQTIPIGRINQWSIDARLLYMGVLTGFAEPTYYYKLNDFIAIDSSGNEHLYSIKKSYIVDWVDKAGLFSIMDRWVFGRTTRTINLPVYKNAKYTIFITASGIYAEPTAAIPLDYKSAVAQRCVDVQSNYKVSPINALNKLISTDEEVRVLVYGQSISEGVWWQEVRDWLNKRFPDAKLVMKNHARGACTASCLIGKEQWVQDKRTQNRLAEDVYQWDPDLIIFHVYGDHRDYFKVLQGFKEHTDAEVLIHSDHRTKDSPKEELWSQLMSAVFIPAYANTFSYHFVPIWDMWGEKLNASNASAKDFLSDHVHLNAAGNTMLASFIKASLCN